MKKGETLNRLDRNQFNGIIGIGQYKSSSKAYEIWFHMLRRCYDPETQAKQPRYIGVTVCERWLNFQDFAHDVSAMPNFGRAKFELDKDLRVLGNKVYSPETCSFIPQELNRLLTDRANHRGNLPIGAFAVGNKFHARIMLEGVKTYIGSYATAIEASAAYCIVKEAEVKRQANIWRDDILPEVYENLMRWRVPY